MQRVLGLDLGVASVGWALTEFDDGEPSGVLSLGARVFEPGVDGDIDSGQEESRNRVRREARQGRRQTQRRARRMRWIAQLLQEAELLPNGNVANSLCRHELMAELDAQIRKRHSAANTNGALDNLPYFLRARALDAALAPHEAGRALYHLAQRRGFWSNRKTESRKDEDDGVVKASIHELEGRIAASGLRTLGEYLAHVDPHAEQRIRGRWTGRDMYKEEFNALWDAQAIHHPAIFTQELKAKLEKAIFHQRPLKSQKHLIGRCDLEPEERRAPWALLPVQRFRLLQRVNDLTYELPDGSVHGLTDAQRTTVLNALEQQQEMAFTVLRSKKVLNLPRGTTFNLERGNEKRVVGNRTAARLRKVFGSRWDAMSLEEKARVVHDVRSIRQEETLKRRAMRAYALDEEHAAELATVKLEEGHCSHSLKAIERLLPRMEQGVSYATAKKEVYGDLLSTRLVCELLPPVLETTLALRNPAVIRTLTELRKVVNALIRKHGKPDLIRIELARDLKQPKGKRAERSKEMRAREKERNAARERIQREAGIQNPKRSDIEKVLLAEECNWKCPYTGRQISMRTLLGANPQFDIEHILPYSLTLDDSFTNKTLCHHEENRTRKGNRTPEAAYSTDELEVICERVKRFMGGLAKAKLRRFQTASLDDFDGFVQRHLNDTRHASTQAAKYLAWLYGPDARTHIQVTTGQVTAQLRNAWELNRLLSDGGAKNREDHRHHVVDAVAIALGGPRAMQQLSYAASRNIREKGRIRGYWKLIQEPYNGFNEEIARLLEEVVVSHRVNRKVNGRLHEDTNYSPPKRGRDGKMWVHIRKPVAALKKTDIAKIVDPKVRRAVEEKLQGMGTDDPSKAFKNPADLPRMPRGKDGIARPIRRVRIRRGDKPMAVGKVSPRYVTTAGNHHAEIVETTNRKGAVVWEEHIVNQLEAMERLGRQEPVVRTDHGEGKRFLFALHPGDTVEINGNGTRQLYVLRGVSYRDYTYVKLTDARLKADIIKQKELGRIRSMSAMQTLNLRPVEIGVLGEVYRRRGDEPHS